MTTETIQMVSRDGRIYGWGRPVDVSGYVTAVLRAPGGRQQMVTVSTQLLDGGLRSFDRLVLDELLPGYQLDDDRDVGRRLFGEWVPLMRLPGWCMHGVANREEQMHSCKCGLTDERRADGLERAWA